MKRDAVDQIEIASPCTVPWSSMRGDDRVRFCGHCRQNVYNIDGFGRDEARRLVAREGRVCVRIFRRSDGTVMTADCWTRLRAARRRGLIPFVVMLLVVGWNELGAMRIGLAAWRWVTTERTAPDPTTERTASDPIVAPTSFPAGQFEGPGMMRAPEVIPPLIDRSRDRALTSPRGASRRGR
jgi:hypothetical protein